MKMDSNLSYFNLPFVDAGDLDFGKIRGQECEYDDLNPTLPSHVSLLGADDDVLAQFLSGVDPLEELGKPDLNGPTTLHCEICKKQFDNAKKYYGHLRVHSKSNLWICDKCPEGKREKFSTKQQLMKHGLTHQPLERVWRCPQCEMSFDALWRLQQHLFAKHLDYRPHKCNVCPKTFHKLSDLDKHKDVHEDINKLACTICPSKFKDKSNLGRHMLTHGDVKPHVCTGCRHRFKQLASLRRHTQNCPLVQKNQSEVKKTYRNNYCRVCGLTFQYKSSLLEHCVREHSNNPSQSPPPPREDKSNQMQVDANRTVDNIVDDILSAEDDYITMSAQHLNYPVPNQDNLMQMELMKEMNQMHNMHILDDELLYNDIDLDSFQTMCNNIERNELFDLNDKSIDHIMNGPLDHLMNGRLDQEMNDRLDQDIMNGRLEQDLMNAIVRGIEQKDELPKEFTPEMNSKVNEFLLDPPVSVNECATIFESDVDLEASTNLAANLNQLIGENTVQYISTEHDDTFIISLNSEIDAEQLTDMLNIGIDTKQETEEQPVSDTAVYDVLNVNKDMEPVKKKRKKSMYVCLICKKIFKRKNNYISHRGTHDSNLQQYQCRVCADSFSYKSSLNKHMRSKHTPLVRTAHTCRLCDKNYNTQWQLKQHTDRDHKLLQPFRCQMEGCPKAFFSKDDLNTHLRFHSNEKPYKCDICSRGFKSSSHLKRHVKFVHSAKKMKKYQNNETSTSSVVPSQNLKPDSNTSIPNVPSSTTPHIVIPNSVVAVNVNPSNSVTVIPKNVIPKSSIITNKVKLGKKTPKRGKSLLLTPHHSKIEEDKAIVAKALGIGPQNLRVVQNAAKTFIKPSPKESKVSSSKSLLLPPKNVKTQGNNIKILQNLKLNNLNMISKLNHLKPSPKESKVYNSKSLLLPPKNVKTQGNNIKILQNLKLNNLNMISKLNHLKVANNTLLITPLQRKVTKSRSLLLRS